MLHDTYKPEIISYDRYKHGTEITELYKYLQETIYVFNIYCMMKTVSIHLYMYQLDSTCMCVGLVLIQSVYMKI
jgi:hypothetical protein